MSHLKPIFDVWDDNAEAMARDIGEDGQKVRQWRHRNSIPSAHWEKIIDAALEKKGVTLTWKQFSPPEPEPAALEGAT